MERRGKGGNEDYYYQERMGLVREALFRRHTFVFKGDAYTGKVVFAPLHTRGASDHRRYRGYCLAGRCF